MSWFTRLFAPTDRPAAPKARLELLHLEDRLVPSTVVGDFSSGV